MDKYNNDWSMLRAKRTCEKCYGNSLLEAKEKGDTITYYYKCINPKCCNIEMNLINLV